MTKVFLASLSAETLIAMWHEYANAAIERRDSADEVIPVLNAIATEYGKKRGICVFLSGQAV